MIMNKNLINSFKEFFNRELDKTTIFNADFFDSIPAEFHDYIYVYSIKEFNGIYYFGVLDLPIGELIPLKEARIRGLL